MQQSRAAEVVDQIVSLRRVRTAVGSAPDRRRLARVTRQLRRGLGTGISKTQAAAALGVSVQALDRWVDAAAVPVVHRPGSSRELIETDALLTLAEEVATQRDAGVSRALARAIDSLEGRGRLPRRLRPNPTSRELRHEFVHSTAAGRLRAAIELTHFAALLAAKGRESRSQPRCYDLLRVLSAHDVAFVVIGDLAVGLHGFVRATEDVDIVPESTSENISRLSNALVELDVRPAEIVDFEAEIEGGGNRVLHTALGRLDLMPYVEDTDGELPHEELRQEAVRVDLDEVGFPVWVASLEHLIGMKTHAGRDQDRIDVTALRMAQGLEDA